MISAAGSVWGIGSDIGGSIRLVEGFYITLRNTFPCAQCGFDTFIHNFQILTAFKLRLQLLRIPAFFNGIFGHKPSRYQVPNGGQFPGDPLDDRYLVTG